MPSVVAAKAASIAAPAAKRAAQSDLTPIIIGVGLLLLLKGFGRLGDLIQKPLDVAGDLAEGTGDFFKGAFGGAEASRSPVETARTPEFPGVIFPLTRPGDPGPMVVLGTPLTFDPDSPTSVSVEIVDGKPVLTVVNARPAVPLAQYAFIGPEPSLAQQVGASLIHDPISGLYYDPILDIGGVTIIPSVRDQVSGFLDTPILGFRGSGVGPSLGDIGGFIKGVF